LLSALKGLGFAQNSQQSSPVRATAALTAVPGKPMT